MSIDQEDRAWSDQLLALIDIPADDQSSSVVAPSKPTTRENQPTLRERLLAENAICEIGKPACEVRATEVIQATDRRTGKMRGHRACPVCSFQIRTGNEP